MEMPSAKIEIDLGKNPKDHLEVIDRSLKYKRSTIKISNKKDRIIVDVKADDSLALLASVGSVMKQMKIVDGIHEMLCEDKVK
jgi:tRNA threonylcarbamoyladenosine modification (KEOPS) complex  Pcc1 subunit